MSLSDAISVSVDEEQARIYLFGSIDDGTAQIAIPAIMAFEARGVPAIHVHLMTTGGVLNVGFAIYDVLRNYPGAIYTYAHGDVLSTGAILFLAGDARIAYPNTSLMLHRPYSTVKDTTRVEFERGAAYLDAQERRMRHILVERGVHEAFPGLWSSDDGDVWVHGGLELLGRGLATTMDV